MQTESFRKLYVAIFVSATGAGIPTHVLATEGPGESRHEGPGIADVLAASGSDQRSFVESNGSAVKKDQNSAGADAISSFRCLSNLHLRERCRVSRHTAAHPSEPREARSRARRSAHLSIRAQHRNSRRRNCLAVRRSGAA